MVHIIWPTFVFDDVVAEFLRALKPLCYTILALSADEQILRFHYSRSLR